MLARIDRDMDRTDLASASGVPPDLILDLEGGREWGRHLAAVGRVASALGVTRAMLFRAPPREGDADRSCACPGA